VPRIKPIDHEDRLSIVEHLDELRTRLIVCALVFAVSFGLCLWQNHLLLDIANNPLPDKVDEPITLSPTEAFTTTMTVSAYFAILLALPIILYQLYAFVLPAFSANEREVALPLMFMVPFLFYAGVVFAYFLVLPAAVNFLQNFNDENYDVLLQARDYNKFAIMVLGVMGLLFQLPVLILAITRMGILTPAQLRKHRRYAILVIAIVAALLPGGDPVTMILMMLPILFLYEGSILLASVLDRRAARARAREEAEEAAASDTQRTPHDPDD
jgi:sec-independent protein translocase protein TatC